MSTTIVSWPETQKDVPSELDAEAENLTILSLCYRKEKLGLAIWEQEDPTVLKMMEEQSEPPGFPTIESIVFEIEPTLMIVPGRGEYEFIEDMKQLIKRYEKEKADSKLAIVYGFSTEYKPSIFLTTFSLDNEQRRIDNSTTVAAASALVATLRRTKGQTDNFPSEIFWFSMSHYMAINYDGLLALQVIVDQTHPNMHITERRGGLCLLHLMNKCKSTAGKRLFKSWIIRPLKSKTAIEQRQSKVESLMGAIIKKGLLPEIQRPLRGLPRIEITLGKLGRPSHKAMLDLVKFLMNTIDLCKMTKVLNLDIACLVNIAIIEDIYSMIDVGQSKMQEKIVIRANVNPDLDQLRHRFRTLSSFLTSKVQMVAERIQNPMITTVNIVYFPQLGFLVTIALDDGKVSIDGAKAEEGFQLQFVTERVAYFKDPITKRLDEEVGDIYADIVDVEIEIVHVLTDQILPHREELCKCGRLLAEFDCLLSLAEVATENNLVKPVIQEGKKLSIKNGRFIFRNKFTASNVCRHLLQERICDNVVANNVEFNFDEDGENSGNVMVLTGPNCSGKSIYMKQVLLSHLSRQNLTNRLDCLDCDTCTNWIICTRRGGHHWDCRSPIYPGVN